MRNKAAILDKLSPSACQPLSDHFAVSAAPFSFSICTSPRVNYWCRLSCPRRATDAMAGRYGAVSVTWYDTNWCDVRSRRRGMGTLPYHLREESIYTIDPSRGSIDPWTQWHTYSHYFRFLCAFMLVLQCIL